MNWLRIVAASGAGTVIVSFATAALHRRINRVIDAARQQVRTGYRAAKDTKYVGAVVRGAEKAAVKTYGVTKRVRDYFHQYGEEGIVLKKSENGNMIGFIEQYLRSKIGRIPGYVRIISVNGRTSYVYEDGEYFFEEEGYDTVRVKIDDDRWTISAVRKVLNENGSDLDTLLDVIEERCRAGEVKDRNPRQPPQDNNFRDVFVGTVSDGKWIYSKNSIHKDAYRLKHDKQEEFLELCRVFLEQEQEKSLSFFLWGDTESGKSSAARRTALELKLRFNSLYLDSDNIQHIPGLLLMIPAKTLVLIDEYSALPEGDRVKARKHFLTTLNDPMLLKQHIIFVFTGNQNLREDGDPLFCNGRIQHNMNFSGWKKSNANR